MRRKYNNIGYENHHKLAQWLESQRTDLEEQRPDHQTVAERAAAALGFSVTENNVKSALNTAGIKYTCRPARRTRHSGGGSGGKASRILAQAIIAMAEELGMSISDDVRQIASARRMLGTDPAVQMTKSAAWERVKRLCGHEVDPGQVWAMACQILQEDLNPRAMPMLDEDEWDVVYYTAVHVFNNQLVSGKQGKAE